MMHLQSSLPFYREPSCNDPELRPKSPLASSCEREHRPLDPGLRYLRPASQRLRLALPEAQAGVSPAIAGSRHPS